MPMQYEHDSKLKPEESREENGVQSEQDRNTGETFSFLKETIKPKTISREKLFVQFARMALYGMIIGLFACCSFFALKPWAQKTFGKETEQVTIPEDEELPEEETAENQSAEESQILDVNNYEQMMDSLYMTAKEAKRSVVSVRTESETDWMEKQGRTKPNENCSTGIIAADTGQELLILADNAVCGAGTKWEALLADGSSPEAVLKIQDKNRGLAVFSVSKKLISDSSGNQIQVAKLGNSNVVTQGDVVIGLGNMFGYEGGLGYGIVSSVEYNKVFSDGQCSVIATNIEAAHGGTGILVNQSGEVIGLIRQGILNAAEAGNDEVTANALAVSDLKAVLELMLNGKKVPYAGIYGVAVTTVISKEQEIPEGLYVTQVESDSPAMASGIQNGDVIQRVNGQAVTGITSFETALLETTAGDTVEVQGQRRGSGGYVDATFSLSVGSRE